MVIVEYWTGDHDTDCLVSQRDEYPGDNNQVAWLIEPNKVLNIFQITGGIQSKKLAAYEPESWVKVCRVDD